MEAANPEFQLEISVVVPAYNEAENIAPLSESIVGALEKIGKPYEVLIVDDGSKDGTFDEIVKASAKYPNIVPVKFEKNCGQTAAFDAGFKLARGRYIITMDGDLQNDPNDIPKLLEKAGEFDLVCGIRVKRRDSFVRRVSSKIGNFVRNLVTHDGITDTGCSLKCFRSETAKEMKLFTGMHRFFPALAKMAGRSVTEIPVNHLPRKFGVAKYGVGNRMFRGIYDLVAVRWMAKRRYKYDIVRRDER